MTKANTSIIVMLLITIMLHVPARRMNAQSSSTVMCDSNVINIDTPQGGIDDDELDGGSAPSSIAPTRTSTDTLAIYNLQGRRITTPQRHTLYIYKGKKYVRR